MMRMILMTLFYSTQEVSEDLENYSELNDVDWSAFPISEEFGVWIPIALIFLVFFGFRFLAKTIERS
jgi:hypothetical protein